MSISRSLQMPMAVAIHPKSPQSKLHWLLRKPILDVASATAGSVLDDLEDHSDLGRLPLWSKRPPSYTSCTRYWKKGRVLAIHQVERVESPCRKLDNAVHLRKLFNQMRSRASSKQVVCRGYDSFFVENRWTSQRCTRISKEEFPVNWELNPMMVFDGGEKQ